MVMSFRTSLPLILMIMTAGVDGQQGWGVNYSPSYVCALKGSSVNLFCTLKYPHDYEVKTAFWTKPAVTDGELPDLCTDPQNRGRVQCLSVYKDTYRITLSNVIETDKHIYYCRFITYRENGKWTGIPGVQLDITDLQVETQQRVNEGDSVTLTCKTTCSLTEVTTFIWFRNTQILTERSETVNQLHLQSVTRDDSGYYRCAVRGHEHLTSPPVYLHVGYPPKNTSVSISSSGEIVEGSSVTLTCSSDSNPPVQNYTWFKENEPSPVGSGQRFSALQSGWFYCVAQNEYGSQRSAAVSVTVKGVQRAALYSVVGIVAGLFFFIIIIIIVLFRKKKRRDGGAKNIRQNQENNNSGSAAPSNDLPLSELESTNQSEPLYDSIDSKIPVNSYKPKHTAAGKESGDVEDVQYASVQHKNKKMIRTEENYCQYSNFTAHPPDPRSVDVIYSSVK